jgi:hypothetical protein
MKFARNTSILAAIGLTLTWTGVDAACLLDDVQLKFGEVIEINIDGEIFTSDKACFAEEDDYQAYKDELLDKYKKNLDRAEEDTFGYFETQDDLKAFIGMMNEEKSRGNIGNPINKEEIQTAILQLN